MDELDRYRYYIGEKIKPTEAAILVLAEAVSANARAIRLLGNADAATPMGGLEALGKVVVDASERLAGAISELAAAQADS